MMVLAIVLGILSGAIGFAPLVLAQMWAKRTPETSALAPMMKLVLGLIASFILLFVLTILFVAFDKGNGLSFVLAEVIALSVTAISYGIYVNQSHKDQ